MGGIFEVGCEAGQRAARRLLVVDDDPAIRRVVGDYLAQKGYAVRVAHDAEEAIRAVESGRRFEVMLVDKNLPGRSGMELIAELRSADREAVLVMFTGEPRPGAALEAELAGASGYLVKSSLRLPDIPDCIEAAVAHHRRWLMSQEDPTDRDLCLTAGTPTQDLPPLPQAR